MIDSLGKVSAVILDLDGTVVDNEGIWEEAFVQAGVACGLPVDQLTRSAKGWLHEPGVAVEANWRRHVGDSVRASELARKTHLAYRELAGRGELMVREGLVELVEECKSRNLRTALCTGSIWDVVERELEELQLQLAFDVTTTGEEVLVGKPDPEIYSLTVYKLNLEPEECLVIEDSVAGVRAAVEAGCRVVGLASAYAPANMFRAVGVVKAVRELREVVGLLG